MATGFSLHIGLNFVDPAPWGGDWGGPGMEGELFGCVNDANDMRAMAEDLGYQTSILLNEEATSARVLAELSGAAAALADGDIFLLTFSGHGGQVPDVDGDEADAKDETLVLYDRQLVDDELYGMWAQFAPGVRIIMLSDSCHSGTVAKVLAANKMRAAALKADVPRVLPEMPSAATAAGARGAEESGEMKPSVVARAPEGVPTKEGVKASLLRTRNLPIRVQNRNVAAMRSLYDTVQYLSGVKSPADVPASVLLISGCQDNQLSADGDQNGRFTQELKAVWDDGTFTGDYRSFHRDILDRMPPDQSPNFYATGTLSAEFEQQRPFAIESPHRPGGAGGPGTARPDLRGGAKGQAVRHLQQRLQAHGYFVDDDGDFGRRTETMVRKFQSDHGLRVDGMVGKKTWQLLDAEPDSGSGATSGTATGRRPTLKQGAQGSDVEHLQRRLIEHGYSSLRVDGNFGLQTMSAVRGFQRANGLKADGIVGKDTWAALEQQPAWL